MITAASLREYSREHLTRLAKKRGVPKWKSLSKQQLVKALLRTVKAPATRRSVRVTVKPANGTPRREKNGHKRQEIVKARVRTPVPPRAPGRPEPSKTNGNGSPKKTLVRKKNPRVTQRILVVHAERERLRNLSTAHPADQPARTDGRGEANGKNRPGVVTRDRIVLMVRDPYWLHAYWEVLPQSVDRVRVAMSEQWHTARPVLRLVAVEYGSTTSTAERVQREIEIHGGVNNWYIDVADPPKSYRVDIGYRAANGRFFSLARSNSVTTPRPGSSDALDQNWSDVAREYEKVYALSGGYNEERSLGDLKEVFEERLRRPMGSPLAGHYGVGAEGIIDRKSNFTFDLDAELVIYGHTKPGSHVTLAGQPVKVRSDGSFAVRKCLPDRRQVLPVVADSGDGLEQRTIILAVERNTKVMEPVSRDTAEQQ